MYLRASSETPWHILYILPSQRRKALRLISKQNIPNALPIIRTRVKQSNRLQFATNYVFVQVDQNGLLELLKCREITSCVYHQSSPVSLSGSTLDALLKALLTSGDNPAGFSNTLRFELRNSGTTPAKILDVEKHFLKLFFNIHREADFILPDIRVMEKVS